MSDVIVVWVDAISPLTVRERSGAAPVAARVVGGSSYTPVAGDPVLAAFVAGMFRVFGHA
jgi:hypothetical protein